MVLVTFAKTKVTRLSAASAGEKYHPQKISSA
jgi:hypothetical protein